MLISIIVIAVIFVVLSAIAVFVICREKRRNKKNGCSRCPYWDRCNRR